MPPPCYCNLPWDIVVEILSWLPAASLLRLRSVSKPLRDLIDSPSFTSKHLLTSVKSNRDLKLIVQGFRKRFYIDLNRLEDCNINNFIINYPLDISHAAVMSCCNGLIFLWKYGLPIILWNPSTMTYQIIPQIDSENIFPCYGFGYDALNDDYKLVAMVPLADYSVYYTEVYLYSLKSDYWKKIEQLIPYRVSEVIPRGGVFVGGALHWTVFQDKNTSTIIAFDVGTEEYRELSKPKYETMVNNEYGSLDVLGESLSFVYGYDDDFMFYMDLWVMKEYGVERSWIKLVSVSEVVRGHLRNIRPLVYSKCRKKVLICEQYKELFWYDLEKNIKCYVKFHSRIDFYVPYVCFDSLVRLKHSINSNSTRNLKSKHIMENSKS